MARAHQANRPSCSRDRRTDGDGGLQHSAAAGRHVAVSRFTAAGAGVVRRARRSSLGVKLGVLGAAIAAAVLCVTFWALSVEIRSNTRQLVTEQLARDQRT